MGGKKKKAKKGGGGGDGEDGEEGEKEGGFTPQVLPSSSDMWVMLEFKLLNWKYMNMSMKFRDTTHIFTIKKMLKERHGRIEDLKVCLNSFSESTEVKDEMMTLRECGLKGRQINMIRGPSGALEMEEGCIPTVQVFYDFKPVDYSDPVMLYFKGSSSSSSGGGGSGAK